MKYSVAIVENINEIGKKHLIRKDGQEDLCFALYLPSTGNQRFTGLIQELVLPEFGDRNVHGNVSFNSDFFDKITQLALAKQCGICLMHSHPSKGWQGMSKDDIETERMLSPRIKAVTGLPLLGMTIGNDGTWSARFWEKTGFKTYKKYWCESVRVIGNGFQVFYDNKQLPKTSLSEAFTRTISAWGISKQEGINRLKVGIVGLGSVGSIVAESLLRIGIQDITLIDFDRLEMKNWDRQFGMSRNDTGIFKVEFYKEFLLKNRVNKKLKVKAYPHSIVENEGFKAALDCDILFSCVDKPWARYVINNIAYANYIPVIDGGIDTSINDKETNIDEGRWKTSTIGPMRRCLNCLGQYKSEDVATEMSGDLQNLTYIKGLPKDHFIHKGENVFAFSLSLAGMEMQQFLSLILQPRGIYYGTKEMDFITGNIDFNFKYSCNDHCDFNTKILGKGDIVNKQIISKHPVAELTRGCLKKKKKPFDILILWFKSLISTK